MNLIKYLLLLSVFALPILVYSQTKQGQKKIGKRVISSKKSQPKAIQLRKKESSFLHIDWLVPTDPSPVLSAGKVNIKLKISSSSAVIKENIGLYNNDQPVNSKADEASLFGNGEEKVLTYKNQIQLQEGSNKIQIKVDNEAGTRFSSPLYLVLNQNKVSLIQTETTLSSSASKVRINWIQPDPIELSGSAFSTQEEFVKIKLDIRTVSVLKNNKITIIHNQRLLPPSSKAVFMKIAGGYRFTDFIQMSAKMELNKIQVRVQVDNDHFFSESLKVNYAPWRPNLHLLAIGTKTNLQYTVKDAQDFAAIFQDQGGRNGNRLFNSINIHTLLGKAATATAIKSEIERLEAKVNKGIIGDKDLIMLFMSSHGFIKKQEFRIQGDDYNPESWRSTSVSYLNDVVAVLQTMPCKKLIFIDACHSGANARANVNDVNAAIDKLLRKTKGLSTIVSSRGDEYSYEDVRWQNGAFTECIIQGLDGGKADRDDNGIITIGELFVFLHREVPPLVQKHKRKSQHPRLINDELGNLSIYIAK